MSRETATRRETLTPSFKSIGVVGATGQTGRLYLEKITGAFPNMPITGIVRQIDQKTARFFGVTFSANLAEILRQANPPETLILATPNPADAVLKTIADNLTDDSLPLTIILPQNGVEVAKKAQDALIGKNVVLIRASLFTPVSSEGNDIRYNPGKLSIGLSIVPVAENEVFDANKDAALQKAKTLFRNACFDTKVFEDFQSMEWTKLVLNAMVSTGGVTGFAPEETLNDPELYELEMRATADRLKILEAAGIKYEDIPWGGANSLPLLDKQCIRKLRNHEPFKTYIKNKIVSGRDNKLSGAWLNIMAGRPTELTYYHQPFIDLAKQYGLRSFVDEAILEVAGMHETGGIDLRKLTSKERKDFLLATYRELIRQTGIAA